jgi:hypothetical protein
LLYFDEDESLPGLVGGAVRPANVARMLTLAGRGAGSNRLLLAAEDDFEFLAPVAGWQGNAQPLVARSRFAAGEALAVDVFGLTRIDLAREEATSYLVPAGKQVFDFVGCREGAGSLAVIGGNDEETLELVAWTNEINPTALFRLPRPLSRALICWLP